MIDRYGLRLSCSSQAAADAYVAAVDKLLSAGADLAAGFDRTLAIDPGFALAQIGQARCLASFGQVAQARTAADRARELSQGTSRRERQHVEALALAIEGKSVPALAAINEHLTEFPRDAMVLAPATGTFGLIAFSANQDYEAQWLALMDRLAPHYQNDWWFETIHAFARCEAGQPAAAQKQVLAALELAPHNANAAHVLTHVNYELGQAQEGAYFLRRWLADHREQVLLRGHLAWHLALWEYALGDPLRAWELYASEIAPPLRNPELPAPPLNLLADVVSWLWRVELAGHRVEPQHWTEVSQWAQYRFPNAGAYLADLHCSVAHIRASNEAAGMQLKRALQTLSKERPGSAVVFDCHRGFEAFAGSDFAAAIPLLTSGERGSARVGGSRAQRELIGRTLLAALRITDQTQAQQRLLAPRPQLAVGI